MAETIQPQADGSAQLPLPDPEKLKPNGLSNKQKRYMYYGIFAALGLLIIANVVGTKQTPAAVGPKAPLASQQQNPSPAQIRDWENGLKQAEAQLEQENRERQQQLEAARAVQQLPSNDREAELARAEALHQAAIAGQPNPLAYANRGSQHGQAQPQKSQTDTEREQQAYKSLFADNVVRQESTPSFSREPHHQFRPAHQLCQLRLRFLSKIRNRSTTKIGSRSISTRTPSPAFGYRKVRSSKQC
jgi:hypothetical protein